VQCLVYRRALLAVSALVLHPQQMVSMQHPKPEALLDVHTKDIRVQSLLNAPPPLLPAHAGESHQIFAVPSSVDKMYRMH
jgi:hypothetical protein